MRTIDNEINSGNFRSMYLLYGSENYLKKQYKSKLLTALGEGKDITADEMNFARFEGAACEPGKIIDLAETMPFFASRRVILLENSGFFKGSGEKGRQIAEYLPSIPDATVLIFDEAEVDAKSAAFNAAKKAGTVEKFETPDEKMISSWLLRKFMNAGLQIKKDAWNDFYNRTYQREGGSLDMMNQESDKLIAYCAGRNAITLEDVQAICCNESESKIYELTSAIAQRDRQKTLQIYSDMIRQEEPPVVILSSIEKQFRRLRLLCDMREEHIPRDEQIKKLKISSGAMYYLEKSASNFTSEEIDQMLIKASDNEEAFKQGRLAPETAVELLLI